jgi:Glucodextranase, domain B/PASTA domain
MRGRSLPVCTVMAIGLSVVLGACGGAARPPAAPVKLSVSSPSDGARVETSTATIAGAVTPRSAHVLVLGHAVKPNADGDFSTAISLTPGTNLIDVITRYVLISVPDVTGESPKAAAAAIRNAGLEPELHGSSDPFNFLIPLSDQVCSQTPGGGAHAEPGSTVALDIGKVC